MADLINDGYTLEEACQISVYPFFSDAGGAESERSYMMKVVQKYLPINAKNNVNTPETSTIQGEVPW
jgi:hypothetical protein